MKKRIFSILGTLALLILSLACGQVITLPTPSPTPSVQPFLSPSPTFSPSPFTITPIFTPTFTPTPILYVVQPGDTLLGIAKKFGVSVRVIQEANAIIDPKSLQAGQTLIIPQGEEALVGTPTPTPTPLPLEVMGVNFYREPGGSLWCFGEAFNSSNVPVESVAVKVKLYGPGDSLLAEGRSFVARDLIPVGEKGPFAVAFPKPPEVFLRYEVVLLSAFPAHSPSALADFLVVKEHSWEKAASNLYVVKGVVQNRGDKVVKDVNVVLVAYDASNRVVALRKVIPERPLLQPGEESAFHLSFFPAGNPPVTYTLYVQGITP